MDQLTDAMCTHGEKVAQLETKIGDLMTRFNETVQECQDVANLFTNTREDTRDRLKIAEDTLVSLQTKVKYQEDTITLLKRDATSGPSSSIVQM
jgi:hypothetical protein